MKILFITHDTTRTGAPMVLLHFLRWLKEHQPQVDVDVLALRGGNMEGEFQENCSNYYNYSLETKTNSLSIIQRILKKLYIYKQKNTKDVFLSSLAKNGYDVIYANTVVAIPIGASISKASRRSKLFAHIHELQVVIRQLLPDFKKFLPAIDSIIVPSEIVKINLVNSWGASQENITVVYECAEADTIKLIKKDAKSKQKFVVGASGMVHWRKGYDLFLLVASNIHLRYPDADILFQWVGKLPKNISHIIDEDIRKLNLQESVNFIGEVSNPKTYFNDFDIFLMTSREDPFPLVCIEVGLLGKPIISFEQATGTNEVILKGGGFVVPYLDIEAMANRVMEYYNSANLVEEHGAINIREFSNFTPEEICPKLYAMLIN
ncbi:glycosyltransferase [Aequorivita sinensis]|uniref:glycosyltransferase n=1 Tax=Aequorivita sinensis TaxID=1382458 RepID=UPI0023013AD5|nr:glycosyltransferase [Aequorivita sinensis]